jgi:cytochrome b6-f complex iron-sulfur subunit
MPIPEESPQTEAERSEKRQFLKNVLRGALALYVLPVPYMLYRFIAEPTIRTKPAPPLALGTIDVFFARADYRVVKMGAKPVLVRREAVPNSGEYSVKAFNLRCTHAGCTVEWQPSQQQFLCRCHNGEFHADGSVKKIPPTKPLEELTVNTEAGVLVLYDEPKRRSPAL